MHRKQIKYTWQCYSEINACFYEPQVHDSLIVGLIKSIEEQKSLDLRFNSTEAAREFKKSTLNRGRVYEHEDHPNTWILCKITIEEYNNADI